MGLGVCSPRFGHTLNSIPEIGGCNRFKVSGSDQLYCLLEGGSRQRVLIVDKETPCKPSLGHPSSGSDPRAILGQDSAASETTLPVFVPSRGKCGI